MTQQSQFPIRRRKPKTHRAEAPLRHWVSNELFDTDKLSARPVGPDIDPVANRWQSVWRRLKRHRLAVVSLWFLVILYFSSAFVEILAPYNYDSRSLDHIYAPPQTVHFVSDGRFIGPHVYGYEWRINVKTLQKDYKPNVSDVQRLRFFCVGDPYKFWGLIDSSLHLFCPAQDGTLFLLGTDLMGRDMLSRILYGMRASLAVSLVGAAVSFMLGVTLGGISGYFGGWWDMAIQMLTRIVRSFPALALCMALAVALPASSNPISVFFGIGIIFGLTHWPELAFVVRTKIFDLQDEGCVRAARLIGASHKRLIFRYFVPNLTGHFTVSVVLSIPAMIIGETILSFLRLGLREPIVSWGLLLNNVENTNSIVTTPWVLAIVIKIIMVLLAFNFLGRGLRKCYGIYL